jgi:hypothetical protein
MLSEAFWTQKYIFVIFVYVVHFVTDTAKLEEGAMLEGKMDTSWQCLGRWKLRRSTQRTRKILCPCMEG